MSLDRSDIASWIPGYTYGDDNITIDRTATGGVGDEGLSAAEANATTGDVAEVLRTLLECVYQQYVSGSALSNFRISKGSSINSVTGEIDKTYSVRLVCAAEDISVIEEPVEE